MGLTNVTDILFYRAGSRVLRGIARSAGRFPVEIQACASAGETATQAFTLRVIQP